MHSEYLHVSRYNFDINLSGVMMKMGNYYLPFSLRISDELLEKLKTIAFYNKRSYQQGNGICLGEIRTRI